MFCAAVGVDAELQALAVDVVGHCLHAVGEALLCKVYACMRAGAGMVRMGVCTHVQMHDGMTAQICEWPDAFGAAWNYRNMDQLII